MGKWIGFIAIAILYGWIFTQWQGMLLSWIDVLLCTFIASSIYGAVLGIPYYFMSRQAETHWEFIPVYGCQMMFWAVFCGFFSVFSTQWIFNTLELPRGAWERLPNPPIAAEAIIAGISGSPFQHDTQFDLVVRSESGSLYGLQCVYGVNCNWVDVNGIPVVLETEPCVRQSPPWSFATVVNSRSICNDGQIDYQLRNDHTLWVWQSRRNPTFRLDLIILLVGAMVMSIYTTMSLWREQWKA